MSRVQIPSVTLNRKRKAGNSCGSRPSFIQTGFSAALGLGLTRVLASRASANTTNSPKPKAKSLIIVFLTGACSHIDTFDMKPEAPADLLFDFGAEVRGRSNGARDFPHRHLRRRVPKARDVALIFGEPIGDF